VVLPPPQAGVADDARLLALLHADVVWRGAPWHWLPNASVLVEAQFDEQWYRRADGQPLPRAEAWRQHVESLTVTELAGRDGLRVTTLSDPDWHFVQLAQDTEPCSHPNRVQLATGASGLLHGCTIIATDVDRLWRLLVQRTVRQGPVAPPVVPGSVEPAHARHLPWILQG
jgi:hypothetical protein